MDVASVVGVVGDAAATENLPDCVHLGQDFWHVVWSCVVATMGIYKGKATLVASATLATVAWPVRELATDSA